VAVGDIYMKRGGSPGGGGGYGSVVYGMVGQCNVLYGMVMYRNVWQRMAIRYPISEIRYPI